VNPDTSTAAQLQRQAEISAFKGNIFLWEVVFTVIVFVAAYFVLKKFKSSETEAKNQNKKYRSEL
jgi:hypothetical protein